MMGTAVATWENSFSILQAGKWYCNTYQYPMSGETRTPLRDPAWLYPKKVPSQIHPVAVERMYLAMKAEMSKARQMIADEKNAGSALKFEPEDLDNPQWHFP